jgi:glutamine amidotransferase
MCRLFGFRSNVISRAHRSLVQAENAVAQQARRHQDGWGIGYFLGSEAYVHKSQAGAAGDDQFQLISERLRSHTFLVHVRHATVGNICSFNAHPFRHGAWMFAHNGSLWGFEDYHQPYLLDNTAPDLRDLIFGATDSEHLFYYLLTALRRAGIPADGRGNIDVTLAAEIIREALVPLFRIAIRNGIDPPKVNFILTNGEVMFAQRAGMELYLATQKLSCMDFHSCQEPQKVCMGQPMPSLGLISKRPSRSRRCNHLIVASEPLSSEDVWEEIPDGRMITLDSSLRLRLHPAIEDFSVSWPHALKPPPDRDGVIRFAELSSPAAGAEILRRPAEG